MAKLFFIHIPKAAGTSLRRSIEASLGPRLVRVYANESGSRPGDIVGRELPDDAVLFGHYQWGLHEKLALAPRYATVLRTPLERVVSWYRWTGSHPHLRFHDAVKQGIPIRDLVPQLPAQLQNAMTRMIAGRPPKGLNDQETLERAKEHLADFAFVSTVSALNRSLPALSETLQVRRLKLRRANESRMTYELSEEDREVLLGHNALDAELYTYAEELATSRYGAGEEPGAGVGLWEAIRGFGRLRDKLLPAPGGR